MVYSNNAVAVSAADPTTADCTGVVLDSNGEPLVGASVLIAGTKLGASTDIDGKFAIRGAKVGTTLRVSYVGCTTQSVKWDGQPLTITLRDDQELLDEVVVVGFGVQKKVNLTGAVSTVSRSQHRHLCRWWSVERNTLTQHPWYRHHRLGLVSSSPRAY
jgi:hypothetical protein